MIEELVRVNLNPEGVGSGVAVNSPRELDNETFEPYKSAPRVEHVLLRGLYEPKPEY